MILIYLIKSTGCLAVLFLFYKVALENKAMHQFKRFYLLASLVFACTIPLVTFTYETEVISEQVSPPTLEFTEAEYTEAAIPNLPQKDYTAAILWSFYGLGVLLFGGRFTLNLVRLKRKISTSEKISEKEFTLSLLAQSIVPHSFFKWVFLNKNQYFNKEIAPEVIAHEVTHVRQKHSWDILFIELLQVLFWFNPLIWLLKIAIKLNHEFLADQGAIKHKRNIAIYQKILLGYANSTDHTALESPFNYSLTKKRIIMLSQTFSRKKLLVRALILIPIIGICTVLFNQAIVAQATSLETANLIPKGATATKWLELWQNKEEYKLFLDGKPIANEKILSFTPEELPYYETKYKRGQTHVSIWTETYWKEQQEKGYSEFSNTNFRNTPHVHISGRSITLNGQPTSIKDYVRDLNKITEDWTTEQHRQTFPIHISVENRDEAFIKQFDKKLQQTNHWKATISYTPASQQTDYVQNFIAGAQSQGKKPLVIEIRNNKIKINGKSSTLANFRKDVDAITKDWEETDYTDPARTYMFKGNSDAFLRKLEIEYAKTHISKANDGATLVPPPPPAPNAPSVPGPPPPPAPPAPPALIDHLMEMKGLGGIFFSENKSISYDEAIVLATSTNNLNVRTPYPYSNPPETYISRQQEEIIELESPIQTQYLPLDKTIEQWFDKGGIVNINGKTVNRKEAQQFLDRGLPAGTTKFNDLTPPELEIMTNVEFYPFPPSASKQEIRLYNGLAKKYNANPNGEIKAKEVRLMFDIYTKMKTIQKKKAEVYPALPPPPSPAPKKVIKSKNDGDKNNPPPPSKKDNKMKLGASDIQEQLPKPNRYNILDHLRVMNRHEAIFV